MTKTNLDAAPRVSTDEIFSRVHEWRQASESIEAMEDSEISDADGTAVAAFQHLEDIVSVALDYRDDPKVGRLAKAVLALATR